jgi:hypothetical protein
MMRWSSKRSLCCGAACLLALATAGCESSDTIAPEGSTIDMTASPAQIVLDTNNRQTSPVLILATVRSGIGVPLAGQDVRFTTNTGILTFPGTSTPAAGIPVETDDDGNARVELNEATTSATITATSGKATDTLNLTAAKGEIAQILLTVTTASFTSCSDTLDMTATVLDAVGMPVENVSISFQSTTSGHPALSFTNNPKLTDASGEVPSTMSFSNQTECQNKCGTDMSGNDQDCSFTIQAKTTFGTKTSNAVDITDLVN